MKTVLVVPCYNEASRLKVDEFSLYIHQNPDIHFCFVNDGSQDSTQEVLQGLQKNHSSRIFVLSLEKNSGKAEAVRRGMMEVIKSNLFNTDVNYVGYWDADLATPLFELKEFLEVFEKKRVYAVFGSRILKLGNSIHRRATRHYLGRVFATCVSLILDLSVYDTQCGSKLFQREIVETCFSDKFVSRWFFDVEILFRIKKVSNPYQSVFEYPLNQWKDQKGSKLKATDFLKAPWELLKIAYHYRFVK